VIAGEESGRDVPITPEACDQAPSNNLDVQQAKATYGRQG